MSHYAMARPDPGTRQVFWLPISADRTEFLPAVLRDISPNELTMVADQQLAVGTVIAVRVCADEKDDSWLPWAHVVYSLKQDLGHWLIGCRFIPGHSDLSCDRVDTKSSL